MGTQSEGALRPVARSKVPAPERSRGHREKIAGTDPELLTVLRDRVLKGLEDLEHGLPSGGELDVNGNRPTMGALGGSVPADPQEVQAREVSHEPKEGLRVELEGLPDLLVAIHPAPGEQGQEPPCLGMRQHVGHMLRRSHHHLL